MVSSEQNDEEPACRQTGATQRKLIVVISRGSYFLIIFISTLLLAILSASDLSG